MKKIIISLLVIAASLEVVAQTFTNDDYKKACWMTTRFYGGQRISTSDGSGPNWLVMDHSVSLNDQSTLSGKGFSASVYKAGRDFYKDADGTTDLSGGWFDCGDHVLFGQTFYYSAYTVLKGFDAFPAGYDDYYSYDYAGYRAAQDFTWESAKGIPNGIPDVLDELRFACEFMIKATPNATTFYSQKGDGDADHINWVTSVAMAACNKSNGGQSDGTRSVVKNPRDASMPSFCAATLALFSRLYAKYDPDFAATCLTHAKFAYQYATSNLGSTTAAPGGFYVANARFEDDYVCAAAELYWATGETSYKTTALEQKDKVKNHNWCYNYNNNDDIAAYNLAKLGDSYGAELLESFVSYYKNGCDANGICIKGDQSWGTMRYPANAAFIVALYGAYKGKTTVDNFIYNQCDWIMGNNGKKCSFIVGFTPNADGYRYCAHPHHRNVYGVDDINANKENMTIPTRNKQFGFLMGNQGVNPATCMDRATSDYEFTEGGIDYNAGLVGALAYIVSRIAPVDTNKFGHPTPDLGPELTLCGTGSATITATVDLSNLKQGEQVTYKWYKGSTLLSQHNGKTSITVTEAGTYSCELIETTGNDWSTTGKVVVSATLPDVAIGDDAELCKVTSATFSTDVAGEGINYTWYKDNKVIAGATTNSYTAYSAGTYKLTISASGCSSKSDEAVVTSQLPVVVGDTICSAGQVSLAVSSDGDYEWYSVATEGSAIATGKTYKPNITKSTTYYVQDAGSINFTAGPKLNQLSNSTNWGVIEAQFTTYAALQITSIDVYFQNVYGEARQTITATLKSNNTTKEFTTTANIAEGKLNTISFENNPIVINMPGNYSLSVKPGNGAVGFFQKGTNYSSYQGNSEVIKFTGASNGTQSDYPFPGLCNWVINSGSSCARTPVFAVLDPDNPNCAGDTEAPSVPGTITVSNITTNSASVSWGASTDNTAVTGYDVYVNGTKLQSVTTNSINLSDLSDNTEYTIKVRAYDEAGNLSEFNTEKSFTTLKSTVTQSISLSAGWNLISFYVLPEDASITNVFGSNISKVSIVKNNDGFYKPGKADKLQSLTEFEYGQAYLVKANSAFSISVEGVAPTLTTISLKAGWNLLGYPKTTEANASNVLSGIAGKYTELKDLSSSQTTLKPGKGYYIKMNSDASVTIGN